MSHTTLEKTIRYSAGAAEAVRTFKRAQKRHRMFVRRRILFALLYTAMIFWIGYAFALI